MHVINNSLPITINANHILPPGAWLVNDDNAFQMGLMADPGTIKMTDWKQPSDGSACTTESIRTILLIRSGAIGDLLFLTPCIAPLKARFPNATITLACFPKHHAIFQDTPGIVLTNYPILADHAAHFDLIIPLENVVELATSKHATDAFAEELGVEVTDYKPLYNVTKQEQFEAATAYPRSKMPRVAIQLRASSRVRDYHMENWGEVINALLKKGWEVFLIGKENPDTKGMPPALKNLGGDLTFREAAAILSTCDVFCGVDSSFMNLCPSLDVPAIGLYAAIDWKTRIKTRTGQRALTGLGECAPCGWTNSRNGLPFPPNQECSKKGYCVVLASIKWEKVVAAIDRHRIS